MKKILFIVSLLLPFSSFAAQVQDLYQVEVSVEDQSSGERLKGMSIAIKEVLVRVSGSKAVVDDPALSAATASPGRYVKGYRYERRQQGVDELDFLLVSFSAKALQSLLVEKQLPIWSAQRPEVLVWLAVDERTRPYIAKDKPMNIVNQAINGAAIARGLPLSWPLDTDVDSGKVRAADVKAGFVQQVIDASKDYATHAVLIGHVKSLSNNTWQGQWQLVREGKAVSWDSPAADLESVMAVGVDTVADALADEFSILSGNGQGLLLVQVKNVIALEGYATTRAYLQDLLITSNVAVVRVHSGVVEYQLRLRGQADEFIRAINLGGKMRVIPKVITSNNIDPSQRLEVKDLSQPDYILELI